MTQQEFRNEFVLLMQSASTEAKNEWRKQNENISWFNPKIPGISTSVIELFDNNLKERYNNLLMQMKNSKS
jgi:hypothetical protein